MTDTDIQALVQAVDSSAQQIVAEAALLYDWSGRQLITLRNTYPAWDIEVVEATPGKPQWVAVLRREHTPALLTAGVATIVTQPDAIALAATLAWQSSLIHGASRPAL